MHERSLKGQPPIYVKYEERDNMREKWRDKAKKLKESGQYEKAIEYFDRIIRANLDKGFARHEKGLILIKLERYEEAVECLKDALKPFPDATDIKFDLGRTLYKLSRWEEARPYIEDVIRYSIIYGKDKAAMEWLKKIDEKIQ